MSFGAIINVMYSFDSISLITNRFLEVLNVIKVIKHPRNSTVSPNLEVVVWLLSYLNLIHLLNLFLLFPVNGFIQNISILFLT